MAACKRKAFNAEWEAQVYIMEHPWPEPAPDLRVFLCTNRGCKLFHITDKPVNKKGRIGKKRR